jgi:hypothetical protein
VSAAREEGTLVWRIEHSVCPPALAPLLDEVKNTLLAIYSYSEEPTDNPREVLDHISTICIEGLKG